MTMVEEMVISGFISKIVSDVVDIPENPIKKAIKDADKKRRDRNQSIETRIYQVTIDSISKFTNDMYKDQDDLYDAAESMIRGFKNSHDNMDAVRGGLKMLFSRVTNDTCEDFLRILYHEICIDKDDVLYREIILLRGKQISEDLYEGFKESNKNDKETHRKLDCAIEGIHNISEKMDGMEKCEIEYYEIPIKNRADEYAQKWNQNVFLNDFNKRDKNAGINIKLQELYLEKHLPHYVWKMDDEPLDDLKELLSEYTVDNDDKKMLLVLGQAGIGKSTLITWIMANLVEKEDDIYVYQFSSDLKNIDWQGDDILVDIFKVFRLRYDELENKVLILDGFDEIYAGGDRERILNQIYYKLNEMNCLKRFSLIITCRKNYLDELGNVKCDYITLQTWDEEQIKNFCKHYGEINKSTVSISALSKIIEKKEVFGVPLILYMVLALNISVEGNGSTVDIYDKIFSVDGGGIYDRCINDSSYGKGHRISEVKQQIHQVSQRIAFWIFENSSAKAIIPRIAFKEICDAVMEETNGKAKDIQSDVMIGSYFEPIKYYEGIGTDELQFVHRSIYEYFVSVYFFESIINLTSKEEIAGKLATLLQYGYLTAQITEFIKHKFNKIMKYNLASVTRDIFQIMLQDGMTYYMGKSCKNAVERELGIFANMLKIVSLWNCKLGKFDDAIVSYLQCNNPYDLNLVGIVLDGVDLDGANLGGADLRMADLSGASLCRVDLTEADLEGADLSGTDLCKANLFGANLSETDLTEADLRGADLIMTQLKGANLSGTNLNEANLNRTLFDEEQVNMLCKVYDLSKSRVFIYGSNEIMNYNEYCKTAFFN